MPPDADMVMLSNGTIHRPRYSELQLIERAGADVEVEHIALSDGHLHTRVKHSAAD